MQQKPTEPVLGQSGRLCFARQLHLPPGQSWLTLDVRFASLFPQQIVQPRSVRLDLDTSAVHDRQVHPGCCVAHSADFIRHMRSCVCTHALVQIRIRVKIEQMFRYGIVVTNLGEVTRLAMLNLEGDTARAASDDGDTSVQRLGDFDFEALAEGELHGDLRVGQQCIQDCWGDVSFSTR